ncbi:MAG TPA: urea carboxylase-associated family protein [Solirubrobacteraceae bacterium]|nr:urea carboxylase-associated family protein [Solirubrobacteraceae bacterium]
MAIALGLTDYQRAVADRLLTMTGAGDFDALAAIAIDHDRRRAPDPSWAAPRPTARPAEQASASVLLDLTLPAASAGAVGLRRGDHLRIEQLDDGQGVDLRAFTADGTGLSAGRTRAHHGINPTTGAALWTAASPAPLLTIIQDTAPGHDLLFPACTEREYTEHAGIAGHLGCDELHRAAVTAAGRGAAGAAGAAGDDVLNLWLPSAVDEDGRLRSWPAACRTGDSVTLRADADVLVTLSCCPDDLFGTSQYEPKPVRVMVTGAAGDRLVFGWPSRPPPSAIPRHELAVELSAGDVEHVDRWAEREWLGCDRRAVTRALVFRLHESLRAA